MKKILVGILFCVACSSNGNGKSNTASDIENLADDIACALAHAEGTDAEVQLACNIAPALWPLVNPALQTHRQKLAGVVDGGTVVTVIAPCKK